MHENEKNIVTNFYGLIQTFVGGVNKIFYWLHLHFQQTKSHLSHHGIPKIMMFGFLKELMNFFFVFVVKSTKTEINFIGCGK